MDGVPSYPTYDMTNETMSDTFYVTEKHKFSGERPGDSTKSLKKQKKVKI